MLTCGKKIFGSLKKQLLEKKPFLPSVQLFNQHFLKFIGFLASTSRLISQRNNKLSYFISLFLDSKGLSYKGLDLASKFSFSLPSATFQKKLQIEISMYASIHEILISAGEGVLWVDNFSKIYFRHTWTLAGGTQINSLLSAFGWLPAISTQVSGQALVLQ